MDDKEAIALAMVAAAGFEPLQCWECAAKVQAALVARGKHGSLVEIRARSGREFMICLSYDGGRASITETGVHAGIRVGKTMIDNLHTVALPFEDWLADFDAVGGIVVQSVTDF